MTTEMLARWQSCPDYPEPRGKHIGPVPLPSSSTAFSALPSLRSLFFPGTLRFFAEPNFHCFVCIPRATTSCSLTFLCEAHLVLSAVFMMVDTALLP